MSRCTKRLLLSLMPVPVALPAMAQTAVPTTSDCSRLRSDPDPFTRRLKLIWDSTRSGVTFSKFFPPVVDCRLLVPTYAGHVGVSNP